MNTGRIWELGRLRKGSRKWVVTHVPTGLRVGAPSGRELAQELYQKLEVTIPEYDSPGTDPEKDSLVQTTYYSVFEHMRDRGNIRYEDKRQRCPTES